MINLAEAGAVSLYRILYKLASDGCWHYLKDEDAGRVVPVPENITSEHIWVSVERAEAEKMTQMTADSLDVIEVYLREEKSLFRFKGRARDPLKEKRR